MAATPRPPAVDPELVRAIEELLVERLGRFGLERVEVRAGRDHAGEPALFVDAWYRLSEEPIDLGAQASADLAVLHRIVASGEERFPFISHHLADGQAIAGMTEGRRRRKAR
jgi:hypothetical protein